MKMFDVTVAISENVPIYEGDPRVKIETFASIGDGSAANVSSLCFGAHTGTHVDAPNHFIEGARRVDALDLEKLIGRCTVVELADDVTAIEPAHVPELARIDRILFKTKNSAFWNTPEDGFRLDFAYLAPATAKLLAASDIKLVGIDYLSIEAAGVEGHPVHVTLLENEIVILEGLDLRQVSAGEYEMICLPLKYEGGSGDGSPARTVLFAKGEDQ